MEININDVHRLCNDGKIKWTTHILARLQEREINPSDVKKCILTGKIIEQYPIDYPHPSCLIVGLTVGEKYLHSVIGVGQESLWLITAYYPSRDKWENNFQTRKVATL